MIVRTLLDTDLYKFTTSYAYIKLFPYAMGKFSFHDRNETEYTEEFMERLKNIREVIGGFDVHCVVENKFLTLFIQVPKNFFEISNDIKCSIDNQKNYENIFIQLVSIFNLIHYFKLDKKLGL